ncbi:carboxypeptidase B-like [Diadema antillarum]|uniref:carboxypeptidase B-like n=1 Tax=Diadema antillarum TaxID=105358 RepID=UPI003A841B13
MSCDRLTDQTVKTKTQPLSVEIGSDPQTDDTESKVLTSIDEDELTAIFISPENEHYKVIRITPRSQDDQKWLKTLHEVWEGKVDYWKHARHVGSSSDVMVPPHWQSEFLDVLSANHVDHFELISNLQDVLDQSTETMSRRRREATSVDDFEYTIYHTLDEIYQWITDFVAENGHIATEERLSTSYENRPVQAIKLGTPDSTSKPVAYIQGGIHAREWISPATMIFLIKKLAESYDDGDPLVRAMLDTHDWYIVPVLNPDGYSYTWKNDRMWRKNRRKPDGNICTGIDLNRNYAYAWGGPGASPNSCSELYYGPSPLSEPEHIGVTDFLLEQQATNGVKLFMDFHSYGQYWLYPWGYTGTRLIEHEEDRAYLDNLAQAARDAIKATHNMDYFVGESGPDLYPASGGSEDWGFGILGARYSYIIELRDENKYGFLLPETQIEPTAEEIYAAMRVVGDTLVRESVLASDP